MCVRRKGACGVAAGLVGSEMCIRERLSRPNKRKEMTQELRQRVFDAHGGVRADCGDALGKFQIDHRVPLCLGGDD